MSRKHPHHLLALLALILAWTGTGSGAVIVVDSFDFIDGDGLKTTSNGTQLNLNTAAPAVVQSVTAGGLTYNTLVFPSASTVASAVDILGGNASRGIANQDTFDVTFASSPFNLQTDFLILSDIGGGDTYNLQLLGAGATPIGNALTGISTGSWGASDISNNVQFGGSSSNNDNFMVIQNLSDFGTGFLASDIVGLRIGATGTNSNQRLDPFIIGLAVPEPSRAVLLLLGLGCLLVPRRRSD